MKVDEEMLYAENFYPLADGEDFIKISACGDWQVALAITIKLNKDTGRFYVSDIEPGYDHRDLAYDEFDKWMLNHTRLDDSSFDSDFIAALTSNNSPILMDSDYIYIEFDNIDGWPKVPEMEYDTEDLKNPVWTSITAGDSERSWPNYKEEE